MDTVREELIIYILVNKELKMDKGKIAGQVAHGINKLHKKISFMDRSTQFNFNCYMYDPKFFNVVITLKATEDEIIEMSNIFSSEIIQDAGRTQVEAGSLTVSAFYPREKSIHFNRFKLL